MEVTVDNIENVQSKTAKFELFFFLFLFVVISFIWSQLSNGTWDDDAIGRYMSIASKPSLATFIDSWNKVVNCLCMNEIDFKIFLENSEKKCIFY